MVLIFSCFSINGMAAVKITDLTETEKDTGNVSFDIDYPEVGKEMKASVADSEGATLFYKWFVDNKQINDFTDSYTPVEDDIEKMITVKVYDTDCQLVGAKSVFVSTIPVIYIETDNRNSNITKNTYMNAQMKIQGNDEYNDAGILYDGKTEIKGRGNSTWRADKKPYKLKLDSKANLFNMGKNKHWVLLSNPYDTSNMRNYLSYNLSNEMGLDASKSVLVDLVLNGRSVGVYQLAEHVRVDETRVDITDWDGIAEDAAKAIYKKNTDTLTKDERDELIDAMTADLSWTTTDTVKYKGVTYTVSDYYKDVPDITGGYLIEETYKTVDNPFTGAFGHQFNVDTPEGVSDDMMNYISEYFCAYETALKSPDYCTVYNGQKMRYTEFIDVESFAKGVLINELFTNSDFGYASSWFSKDVDGKLVFGPIWDMDLATSSGFNSWITVKQSWVKRMLSDPVFMKAMRDVYLEYRYTVIQNLIEDDGAFDKTYNEICDAAVHNDKIWQNSLKFEENASDLRLRLQYKIDWLDSQLLTLDGALSSVASYQYEGFSDYNQAFNQSSDIALTIDGNTLNIGFDSVPAKADVFVNGVLNSTLEIENPEATAAVEIDAEGEYVVNVVTYDAEGNALGGRYITNQIYITSLDVTESPTKTEYAAGESLDLSGILLTAKYSDGTQATVEPETAYTYTKDSLGTQCYIFGEVTEQCGDVYLVLCYKGYKAEISLKITPNENYEEVSEYIAKIPSEMADKEFIKTLFEAWVKYEALSESAKANVANAEELQSAIALIDEATAGSDVSYVGSYADGLVRENSKNKLVIVVKDDPRNIVIKYPDDSTNTFAKGATDNLYIKKIGRYSIWTVSFTYKTSDTYYDVRANYSKKPTLPLTRVDALDLFNSETNISEISYPDFIVVGQELTVKAKHGNSVSALKLTEKGKSVGETETSSSSEMNLKFDTVGKHKIDVNYKVGNKWIKCETKEVYVRDAVEKGKVFYVQNVKNDYKEKQTVKIITDETINDVSLIAVDENLQLNSELINGYKLWTGEMKVGKNYSLSIDGAQTENEFTTQRLGDVNNDGQVNSLDALLILQHTVEKELLSGDELIRADITLDGVINSADALHVLQVSTGKI